MVCLQYPVRLHARKSSTPGSGGGGLVGLWRGNLHSELPRPSASLNQQLTPSATEMNTTHASTIPSSASTTTSTANNLRMTISPMSSAHNAASASSLRGLAPVPRKTLLYRYCGNAPLSFAREPNQTQGQGPMSVNIRCQCDISVSVGNDSPQVRKIARHFAAEKGRLLFQQQLQKLRPSLLMALRVSNATAQEAQRHANLRMRCEVELPPLDMLPCNTTGGVSSVVPQDTTITTITAADDDDDQLQGMDDDAAADVGISEIAVQASPVTAAVSGQGSAVVAATAPTSTLA